MRSMTFAEKIADLRVGDTFTFLDWQDEGDEMTLPGAIVSLVFESHGPCYLFEVTMVHDCGAFETVYAGLGNVSPTPKRREALR